MLKTKAKQGGLFERNKEFEKPIREVKIYTDGCSLGNPGPGGWACCIIEGGKEIWLSSGTPYTTNNQMELQAVISALSYFKKPRRIRIFTDSNYVLKGITEWLPLWKKRNFKTSEGKPVKNMELWQKLEKLVNFHSVSWEKVKAHSGNPFNEKVDRLAKESAKKWKKSSS